MAPIADFLLDSTTGGLAVVNGDFAVVGGQTDAENLEAVRQGIQTRLRLWFGEDWLNELAGVPWREQVLIKNANPQNVQAVIGDTIASTPGVTSVVMTRFAFDRPNRAASITYSVSTQYSAQPLTGTVAL